MLFVCFTRLIMLIRILSLGGGVDYYVCFDIDGVE